MKTILNLFTFLVISSTTLGQTNTAETYLEKANTQIDNKAYEQAIATLNEGIKALPNSPQLYDMRGTILEAFQLFNEAKKDFTTAINLTADKKFKSHLYSNRGGTKFRVRDYQGCYDDLIIAIELDPENIDALNNLAAVCDEVNKPKETLIHLEKIITINPNYVPAYVNIGFKYQSMNKHKKAIEYFNKAIELEPNEALAYSNRSYSKLQLNDLENALLDINKSLELMDANSYAYKIRALIQIQKNDLSRVCEDLNIALELGYTLQYGEEVNELKIKHCD